MKILRIQVDSEYKSKRGIIWPVHVCARDGYKGVGVSSLLSAEERE